MADLNHTTKKELMQVINTQRGVIREQSQTIEQLKSNSVREVKTDPKEYAQELVKQVLNETPLTNLHLVIAHFRLQMANHLRAESDHLREKDALTCGGIHALQEPLDALNAALNSVKA